MTFPAEPLGIEIDLNLGGQWTDVTSSAYQRDGTAPPVVITRGRPDETEQADPSSCTFELNNRNGQFSPKNPSSPLFGLLGRNTAMRVSVPAQTSYLRIEDDTGSGVTAPNATRLQVSGTIDIRLDYHPTDYQGREMAFNDGFTAGTFSWFIGSNANGTLTWQWSPDGTAVGTAVSTMPVPLGRLTLRVLFNPSAGTVSFFTGPPGSASSTGNAWTLLGTVVSTGATSLHAGTAGIQFGFFFGAVFEFAVFSGNGASGGTLVADPVFTAQAPGTTSFTDAQGNTWTLTGTAEISSRNYRYHGETSSLPGKWDATGNDVSVPVTAGGLLRRIGQGDAPEYSPMKRAILLQTGDLAPVAYWPCEDLQGAQSIGSAVGGQFMTLSGGTGDGSTTTTGPAFAADNSFLASNSLPTLNGSTWFGQVPTAPNGGAMVVRFLAKLVTIPASGGQILMRILTSGTASVIDVLAFPGGGLGIEGFSSSGASLFSTGSVAFGADNANLWYSVEATPVSGGQQYNLVVLAPGNTTGAPELPSPPVVSGGVHGNCTAVQVNPNGFFTDSIVGHISVQDAESSLFALGQPLNAWQGETAATRFVRLCGENGLASRVIGAPSVSAVMGAQSVDTLPDLLQECEDADKGLIFEPRQQLALGYRTLAAILAQAPVVTADYSQAMLGGVSGDASDSGLDPTFDDQFVRNDMTLTRGNATVSGADFQFQLNDGSAMSISQPPAGIGDYADSDTVNVLLDSQLPDIAGWVVHIGTVDEARWPSMPWNLARPEIAGTALMQALLGADMGDFAEVVNLPAVQVADPVRALVYQSVESLGGFHWTLLWNTVPESPYEVIILNDPVTGRVDTDGSTLGSPATTGSPAVLSGRGAGWTGWGGTSATVATSGENLVVTAAGGGATFFQAFGPASSVTAGQEIAVYAEVTAQEALGALSLGIHFFPDDTFPSSPPAAVTAGEKVLLSFTATAAAGQTGWSIFVVDSEDAPAGTAFTLSAAYGAPADVLPVFTDSGFPVWTQAASDMPFDIQVDGERITVVAVAGSSPSEPQDFTAIRAVNGVSKTHVSGAAVELWHPPYLSLI